MVDITQILAAIDEGDSNASAALLPIVYGELRRLARQRLARESPGQTLQATALVHEAYLRLIGPRTANSPFIWNSQGHFFAAAAEAMRRVLIESARRKLRARHGGGLVRIDLETVDLAADDPPSDFSALNAALEQLQHEDPVKAELVKLKYFAGLTLDEAASVLGISPSTADRHWAFARAWLYRQIGRE